MKILLSILLVLYCFIFATAAPFWGDDFDRDFDFSIPDIPTGPSCQELGCPDTANSCSRKTETIDDRRTIQTTVVCSNNGQVLTNHTSTSPNPNPGSIVNGFEYFGSFTGGNQVITHNNNDQVETFNKK